MRRVWAQARKELIQIRRDRLALTLALILPLMLILLLSFAISLTVHRLPIIIRDFDDSMSSRRFADAVRASISFQVVSWPPDKSSERALLENAARGVLVIPRNFGRDLLRGRQVSVQLLVDASDSNTARLTQGYLNQLIQAFNRINAGARAPVQLVGSQVRLWYNPGLDSPKFYSPGIFVLGISMFPPLLASLAMARETDQKTILQVYVSSITAAEFILGKVLAYSFIAFCEWLLSLALLLSVFGLAIVADPTPLIVGSLLYTFCVASFGVLIGVAVPNQAAAIQAVSVGGFLLVFLLSGLIFPVENIPAGLRWISNLIWGRYYIAIVRDALLQGGGWPSMWPAVTAIAFIGALFFWLAWLQMRAMQVKA